ncbi:MAG: HD-GYP domain-containing protein [Vulcanimicrobiota bacterium]
MSSICIPQFVNAPAAKPLASRPAAPAKVEQQLTLPFDQVQTSSPAAPTLATSSALKTATLTALQTASAAAPGTWMLYPAEDAYRGRLDQDLAFKDLRPYAQQKLGELPENLTLGQVLAYTGASSLTDVTRNLGKYRQSLDELAALGQNFQGSLVVNADNRHGSLVVLAEQPTVESTRVGTLEGVWRNERARAGLLNLLDNPQWQSQLEGSRLAGLRPQLEDPSVEVKSVLTQALGELEGGYTAAHMQRAIDQIGIPLAEALADGKLAAEDRAALKEAGGLFDIGKLAIDEKILDFPGKWPDDKAGDWFAKISNHVHPDIVGPLLEAFNPSEKARQAVLLHHERPNGWAYCKTASAPGWDNVPSLARVVGIADTIDAMQWKKANLNRPVEAKLDLPTIAKFLVGDAEKGKVDGELVKLAFDKVLA